MLWDNWDAFWNDTAQFLLQRFDKQARLLAPNEFHQIFFGVYPYSITARIDLDMLDGFVVHKGMLQEIGVKTLSYLTQKCVPAFGNEVFVVFARESAKDGKVVGEEHLASFYEAAEKAFKEDFPIPAWALRSQFKKPTTVVLITTFNRPHLLEKSLPSISQLGVPMLLVNDGSDPQYRDAYQKIYQQYDLKVIDLPHNRGLPNALNTGLGYWLADPLVEWISYLQDDTEVRQDLFRVLELFQDAKTQPILSGRHTPQHRIFSEEMRGPHQLLWKRMNGGNHVHAHRGYWEKMLPIPSPYFQSPKKLDDHLDRGADEDWWVMQWSPHSIVKQGGYVCVIPGLVRTLVSKRSDSTWGGYAIGDPPLASPIC